MPRRNQPFANGYFYHIYNRGVEKRTIFQDNRDFNRFLKMVNYYQYAGPKPSYSKLTFDQLQKLHNNEKIVEIICYCLMPNHFHLLLKQTNDNGITDFVRLISNGYTRYFNLRHQRIGPLLQGAYKAVIVESDEQLVHLSRYIHLNPLVSFLIKDLNFYQWSSYPDYLELKNGGLINKKEVLSFFKDKAAYEKFTLDQADYGISLERIKHQLLDPEA